VATLTHLILEFYSHITDLLVLHCWLRGTTSDERFDITIGANASMSALKAQIKAKESRLKDVDESRIRLYRISESEDELRENLDTLDAGHLLDVSRSRSLSDYFKDIPVAQRLQLVVQIYSDNNSELMKNLIESY
jgi:hypothetical protein